MGKVNQLFQDRREAKFDAWMIDVETICQRRTGLSTHDFDDFGWAEAFEDGMTPEQAFEAMYEDQIGVNDAA